MFISRSFIFLRCPSRIFDSLIGRKPKETRGDKDQTTRASSGSPNVKMVVGNFSKFRKDEAFLFLYKENSWCILKHVGIKAICVTIKQQEHKYTPQIPFL
jgi:hypothetical protein